MYNKSEFANFGISFIKFKESELDVSLFKSILDKVEVGDDIYSIKMIKYGDLYLKLLFYDKVRNNKIPNDKILKDNWNQTLLNFAQFNERVDNIGNRYYYIKKKFFINFICRTNFIRLKSNYRNRRISL